MEKQAVVNDLDLSQVVLGVAVVKQLESNGAVSKKATRNNAATMDMLVEANIPAIVMVSPYNNSGKALKKEYLEEGFEFPEFKMPDGESYTLVQVYDAIRLAVAHGYCNATEWSVYTMAAGEKATDALEVTKTEVTKAVQDRLTSIRRGVERREAVILAKAKQAEAQEAERLAAELEGRDMAILPLSDFEVKKDANSKKAPRDAANDNIVNSIRVLTKEVEPEHDNTGAIKALRAALVCLNLDDPTTDENDEANK